jgi:hypothetical protein
MRVHRSRFAVLIATYLLLAPLALYGVTPAQAASAVTVAVIYDGTYESDCLHFVREADGPIKEFPCPPGSVIFAVRMSEDEARAAGFDDYVVLSGDESADHALIIEQANNLHEAFAGSAQVAGPRALLPAAASCSSAPMSIGGSYVNPRSGGRTYYAIPYSRGSDCRVTNVRDQAYRTGSATIRWDWSCTNSGTSCSNRFFNLTSNWSALQWVPNSWVGEYYGHYSTCTSGCGISNGVQALGYIQFV